MYKNKEVEMKVVCAGKKNLHDAKEFLQTAKAVGKETLLIVGNNDISNSSATEVYKYVCNISDLFKA